MAHNAFGTTSPAVITHNSCNVICDLLRSHMVLSLNDLASAPPQYQRGEISYRSHSCFVDAEMREVAYQSYSCFKGSGARSQGAKTRVTKRENYLSMLVSPSINRKDGRSPLLRSAKYTTKTTIPCPRSFPQV